MSDNPSALERATLDASALLGPRRGELLAAADLGYFHGYWSGWIAQEMARESTEAIIRQAGAEGEDRQELKRRLERSRKLVNSYRDYCSQVLTMVDYTQGERVDLSWLGDEGNRRTMATAIAAGVPGILVTDSGNSFPLGQLRNGVRIISSSALLDALYQTHPEAEEKVAEYLARNPGLLLDGRSIGRFEIIAPQAGFASHEPAGTDACRLFAWLWERLSSYLGTPTTAALLRRALSGTSERHPGLKRIVISRQGLTYSYYLPEELCGAEANDIVPAFRMLVAATLGLVGALTGGTVVRKLMDSGEFSPWLPNRQEVDEWQTPAE